MNTVSVSEVVRRYHVSQSQRDYKERLDTLTENLIREYLEVALDNVGCRPSDILCIRYLNIPILFDPDKTDFEIFAAWLRDLETAISNLLAKGHHQQWVSYPSIIEALISVARGMSNRQLDDQWAWQQIGIIPRGQHNLAEIKTHWINYLSQHAEIVPAVIAGASKDSTVQRLISAHVFDSKDMLKLILLNFKAFGISADWHDIFVNVSKSLSFERNRSTKRDGQMLETLNRLNVSWKALFNGSELSSFIADIYKPSTVLHSKTVSLIEELQLFYGLILVSKSSGLTQVAASQQRIQNQLISWLNDCRLYLAPQTDLHEKQTIDDKIELNGNSNSNSNAEIIQPLDSYAVEQPSKLTGYFGGVLFVLNLLKEENWHAALMNLLEHYDSPIAALKQLCVILLAEIEQDAVLSVFTGAIFEELELTSLDYSFNPKELTQLGQFADSIKLEIVTRLTGETNEHLEAVFAGFCRKQVKIEFASGWVKVFYSLDDADTNVRASGLDLDPGFIPWLGYVVTFHYE